MKTHLLKTTGSIFFVLLNLIITKDSYALSIIDEHLETVSKESAVCATAITDVKKRDQNQIEALSQITHLIRSYDKMYDSHNHRQHLDVIKNQWTDVTAVAGRFIPNEVSWALASQKMLDNYKEGTITDYGILSGAHFLTNYTPFLNTIQPVSTPFSQYNEETTHNYAFDNPSITILGNTDSARGTSRSSDLTAFLFSYAFVLESQNQELPPCEFNYFAFAERLKLNVTNSQIINRHLINASLLNHSTHENANIAYIYQETEEEKIQIFNIHSGYAFGARRGLPEQLNEFGPTDCSEWMAYLFYKQGAKEIYTGAFKESALKQQQLNSQELTDFDRKFQYIPISENAPIIPGDILCKPGHVAIYVGNIEGKPSTLSASRNRGLQTTPEGVLIPGSGIEGVGLRLDDPLYSHENLMRFKVALDY